MNCLFVIGWEWGHPQRHRGPHFLPHKGKSPSWHSTQLLWFHVCKRWDFWLDYFLLECGFSINAVTLVCFVFERKWHPVVNFHPLALTGFMLKAKLSSELQGRVQETGNNKILRKCSTACRVSGPSKHGPPLGKFLPCRADPCLCQETCVTTSISLWKPMEACASDMRYQPPTALFLSIVTYQDIRTPAERTDLPSWFCSLESNWILYWSLLQFPQT